MSLHYLVKLKMLIVQSNLVNFGTTVEVGQIVEFLSEQLGGDMCPMSILQVSQGSVETLVV